jgi:hypothetical protein
MPAPVPERLARYVAAEWCGDAREWKGACLRWLGANPGSRLPFGEHGDEVDVLRETVRHLRALPRDVGRFT